MTQPMEDDEDFYGEMSAAPVQISSQQADAPTRHVNTVLPQSQGESSRLAGQAGSDGSINLTRANADSYPVNQSSLLTGGSAEHVTMNTAATSHEAAPVPQLYVQDVSPIIDANHHVPTAAAQTSTILAPSDPGAKIIEEPKAAPSRSSADASQTVEEDRPSVTIQAPGHGPVFVRGTGEHSKDVDPYGVDGALAAMSAQQPFLKAPEAAKADDSVSMQVGPPSEAGEQEAGTTIVPTADKDIEMGEDATGLAQDPARPQEASASHTSQLDIPSSSLHSAVPSDMTEATEETDRTQKPGLPASKLDDQIVIDEAEAALAQQTGNQDTAPQDEAAGDAGPEFEADSSPYESSSDDSSDSSSEDSDDDYPMLDAREQARLLMEDGGSDDEGGKKGNGGGAPRTQNEQIDEIVRMPDVEVTEDMKIEELGSLSSIIGNVTVVKGKTSAEFQVLDTNSLLCRADRKVIGVVSETIGRVEEPHYLVRFTNAATITEFGLETGSTIYYVPSHSNVLFTKTLHVKGSDASNLHDEEVGENEMEFSDDEAEQAYKASIKRAKRANKDISGGANSSSRMPPHRMLPPRPQPANPDSGPMELSYDDNGGDDLYTPLSRPQNMADLMRTSVPGVEVGQPGRIGDGSFRGQGSQRGRGRGDGDRGGRGGGRGRGGDRGRGRGRGDFGGRGRGRGYNQQGAGYQSHQQPDQHNYQSQNQGPVAFGAQAQQNTYTQAQSAPAPAPYQQTAPYNAGYPQYNPGQGFQPPPLPVPGFANFGHPPSGQSGFAMPPWPAQQQYPQSGQPYNAQYGQQQQGQSFGSPSFPNTGQNGGHQGYSQHGQYPNQ